MPTTRPRVLVTETEDLARALTEAQRTWPEETSRSRLLARLALLGSQQLERTAPESVAARRRRVLERGDSRFRGLWPAGYRDQLRDEWPD